MSAFSAGGEPSLRAPVRLRVGVSGHRQPPKLPAETEPSLRAHVGRILTAAGEVARAVGDDRPCELAVVSSLAEGADRIIAEAGLAAGFALNAILPFARAEYERDFATAQSRAVFADLLARAAAVIELNGTAAARPQAYEAAGLLMLANVDLLIAIWDGAKAAGVGGTAQIVGRALGRGIVVAWIKPTNPGTLLISTARPHEPPPADAETSPEAHFRTADAAAIGAVVKEITLRPPR
jgi:hypothetical protein